MKFNTNSELTDEQEKTQRKAEVDAHGNTIRQLKHDIVNLQIAKENIELFLAQAHGGRMSDLEAKEKEILDSRVFAENVISKSLIAKQEAEKATAELHKSAAEEQEKYEANKAELAAHSENLQEKESKLMSFDSGLEEKQLQLDKLIKENQEIKYGLEGKESSLLQSVKDTGALKEELQQALVEASKEKEKYIAMAEEARLVKANTDTALAKLEESKQETINLKKDLLSRIEGLNAIKLQQQEEARNLKARSIEVENKTSRLNDIIKLNNEQLEKLQALRASVDSAIKEN